MECLTSGPLLRTYWLQIARVGDHCFTEKYPRVTYWRNGGYCWKWEVTLTKCHDSQCPQCLYHIYANNLHWYPPPRSTAPLPLVLWLIYLSARVYFGLLFDKSTMYDNRNILCFIPPPPKIAWTAVCNTHQDASAAVVTVSVFLIRSAAAGGGGWFLSNVKYCLLLTLK